MKKVIAFVLVSMAAQNLSAPISGFEDYVCKGRRTPIRACYAGTDDWLSGGGPAMSLSDAVKQDEIIRKLKEKKDKEDAESAILTQLHKIPTAIRAAVLGNVFSQSGVSIDEITGFQTPPEQTLVKTRRSKKRLKKATQGDTVAGKTSVGKETSHSLETDRDFRRRSGSFSPIGSPVSVFIQ